MNNTRDAIVQYGDNSWKDSMVRMQGTRLLKWCWNINQEDIKCHPT
jgi:hypothetical protein